ncbi:hypothetical protein B1690_09345 [Geobacillus sp. 46C-IIa]|uniref:hypothetical protein n=1 Tax=Geobacillus sp. 46C-IIa TaxID=1963025 RepID=UPI0009BED6E9|nr:hypothetical protein [Geobacillus sp. 46C-IIa]OQP06339.1 hypothetical protein B1690_09345 [Geobacillus sp. 46C-IIa]QNU28671.1 hypothetical protein IC803_03705 [Geobacillus sp. 46C-IIa]
MNRLRLNEAGYSLVTTMLVITIFFLLGLTILTVAAQQARFTHVRVEEIESFQEAANAIDETVAALKTAIAKPDFVLSTPARLDDDLSRWLPAFEQRYGVIIRDATEEGEIDRQKLFTRVLYISKPHGSKTVTRRVIIANTPSFLKYALGSSEDLTVNGGAYIDGHVYAGNDAYITNAANYIDHSQRRTEPTSFPTLSADSAWLVQGEAFSCTGGADCYQRGTGTFLRQPIHFSLGLEGATVQKETDDFIDVDFNWTVKDKLLNAAGIETFSDEYEQWIDKGIPDLLSVLEDRLTVVDDIEPLLRRSWHQSVLLHHPGVSSFFVDRGEIDLKKHWLIVNGDLFLGNTVQTPTKVRGNLIVLGDLTIQGNVAFDASVYVTGRTLIYDADISGWGGKELVLLTDGPLELARINEFHNSFPRHPNLKGYFYTSSNATVYAVGSYIHIQGGLFARGDASKRAPDADISGLVVNAYRGRAENGLSFIPAPNDDIDQSRLVIRHDPQVLIDRGEGLPFVKRLSLVVDRLKVE